MPQDSGDRLLATAAALIAELADQLDLDASVRLWDGSRHPLGRNVKSPFEIAIADPGVIGALVRWPSLDVLIRQYVDKGLELSGGSIIDFGRQLNREGRSVKLRGKDVLALIRRLSPFLFVRPQRTADDQGFAGNASGKMRRVGDNRDYIQFHYDLSNEFYALFLDPEMVYSCAYFTSWENDLAAAQRDKLDMICRKLRLKPGERLLDVGCGWGGLVCHAARHYGVRAHGITLSEEQLEHAQGKAGKLGIGAKATFELADYGRVSGTYDKIASIGMYEHIGLADIPAYMGKIRSLLSEDGLFLNHAISRRAKRPRRWLPERLRPEQKALQKYIFPGGELDDIGHSIAAMERAGFEVHDVEGWREHYARTCSLWYDRLAAEKDRAVALVGEEKYRIWLAYLAGCSIAFSRGTARIYQTLASKSAKRPSPLPPTRADLYARGPSKTG